MEKVALLIPSLRGAGAEKIAALLSKKLRIPVITFESGSKYNVHEQISLNIPWHGAGIIFLPIVALKLKKVLESRGIDVVLSFDERANFVNSIVAKKPILSIHRSLKFSLIGKILSPLRNFLYRGKPLVVVSHGLSNEFKHLNPIVIYNGIEQERCADEKPYSFEYILAVGRLVEQKNHELLLKAFAAWNPKNVKLVIKGRGPRKSYLQRLAKKLGIADKVIFDDCWTESLACLYKYAKFVVLTSRYEGFSLTVAEALAQKTPVVAVNCPWGPQEIVCGKIWVSDEQICDNGIICQPNIKSLVSAFKYMSENRDKFKPTLRREFTAEHMVESYKKLFLQVLGKHC